MIRSMTSFGRVEESNQWGNMVWEIRTVNHRYLEINTRLPEELRSLDTQVRHCIQSQLKRGKVDCGFRFEAKLAESHEININTALTDQIIAAAKMLANKMDSTQPVSAIDILKWPGVIKQQEIDIDSLSIEVLSLLDRCLQQVFATRLREGNRIQEMLNERCNSCQDRVNAVRAHLPESVNNIRNKLHHRVSELCNELDNARVEQEVVLLAQKYDVAEELDRLEAHISEVSDCLHKQEVIGRRLDFLMQEMNREANTLGSKAADIHLTNASVDLKVLIEQMREQIQNIE